MPYLRRVYRLPAELEESLAADLWHAGTLGASIETEADGRLRLTAWFPAPSAGRPIMEESRSPAAAPADPQPLPSLRSLPPLDGSVELVAEDVLPDTDWMAEYRRQAVPFPVGQTLLVDPREPGDLVELPAAPALAAGVAAVAAGRRLLRLPARTAFGIGSHPSTSLALELLEAAELSGRAVLDAGTGTGILAFAALAWGAARVVAFDADPVAAFQARANSRLNGLHPVLFAGRAAALAPHRGRRGAADRFDLVVANVVPEEILPDLADLLPALAPGGALVLSGLLAERVDEVLARLAAFGLAETGRRRSGEWAALRLLRGAHASGCEARERTEARP